MNITDSSEFWSPRKLPKLRVVSETPEFTMNFSAMYRIILKQVSLFSSLQQTHILRQFTAFCSWTQLCPCQKTLIQHEEGQSKHWFPHYLIKCIILAKHFHLIYNA